VSGEGLKAAYCGGRLTLFDAGRIVGTTELPAYFAELADCGAGVLAWNQNTIWLVDRSTRVQSTPRDRPSNPRCVGSCERVLRPRSRTRLLPATFASGPAAQILTHLPGSFVTGARLTSAKVAHGSRSADQWSPGPSDCCKNREPIFFVEDQSAPVCTNLLALEGKDHFGDHRCVGRCAEIR